MLMSVLFVHTPQSLPSCCEGPEGTFGLETAGALKIDGSTGMMGSADVRLTAAWLIDRTLFIERAISLQLHKEVG